jgi:methyl-accepting chemotaxis protein
MTGQLGQYKKGTTMPAGPFEIAKYKRPQFDKLAHGSDAGEMPANFGEVLDQVSKNSTGEIDSLIGEFQRLRGTLQTDGERIKREIEEYRTLSQQVMQLTKTISENVEKVRASAHRSTRVPQEKD